MSDVTESEPDGAPARSSCRDPPGSSPPRNPPLVCLIFSTSVRIIGCTPLTNASHTRARIATIAVIIEMLFA